ncbi:hypothetical protein T439DRAFT_207542 [Meredithblackwellia eburnea MCA 4105]
MGGQRSSFADLRMSRSRNVNGGLGHEPDQIQLPLPTSRSSPSPTSHKPSTRLWSWSLLFLFLQLLSVIPSLLGFFWSVHKFYATRKPLYTKQRTWVNGGRSPGVTEGTSTQLDWFLAGMWALTCAYFSYSLAKGLLRRWLVYYSLLPTVIRSVSLQAICWPLTLLTHRILTFDQPVAAWLVCATTAAISNVIQIWVTSNIVERKDRRGPQRWQFFATIVSAVLGPGVRTEKFRKSERAMSWKRVLWSTVVPLGLLGWATTCALLWQQFVARYKGGGGVEHGLLRLNYDLPVSPAGHHLRGLDTSAEIRVVILVTSSWTARSMENRQKFRNSSVLMIPPSSSSISIAYRFLVGKAPSPQAAAKVGPLIDAEAAKYGDMLAVPAFDTYQELSKKVYEGWKWAGQLDVDYVLKTDDDIFVRMDVIAKELKDLGKQRDYWRGFAYWDIPAIKDASNKNADFGFEMSTFPPYTAGALHILSRDLVQLAAPPTAITRLFVMNEDQNLGLWLYPSGVRPIHDHRIQQGQVCENDMIAKHFGGQYKEEGGIGLVEMYANVKAGRKMCEGFLQRWCGVCYPSCRSRDNHWREWGFACDDIKGATLSQRQSASTSSLLDAPLKVPKAPFVLGSSDDPWVIPGILSRHTSPFSTTDDWHLLHMLCWTTPPETFQERHYQALETIWAHEPRAILFMMSTSLPLDFFDSYTQHGYAIHVVRIGGQELLDRQWFLGPNSEQWLKKWDQWAKGPNFYSHLTDYLRYLFLFKFGGTYLDMDAPWVRSPPNSNVEFIGADFSTLASDIDWTLDEDGMYLAPGVMRFKRGWSLFRNILENAFSVSYKPACFNCVGPRAITLGVKADRRRLELAGFTILPSHVLYPKNWITSHELVHALPAGEAAASLAKIVEGSYSIHLFGKMTNHLRIHDGSIINEAFETFSLKIPRRIGAVSSTDRELGNPQGLGAGLDLRAPSKYIYRSRLALEREEVKDLDTLGSLDGRFEGLNVIFIRATKSPRAPSASVVIETKNGGRITVSSSSGRAKGRVSLDVIDGELGGSERVRFDYDGSTSVKDINTILSSLSFSPRPGVLKDWLRVFIRFGDEELDRTIEIDTGLL